MAADLTRDGGWRDSAVGWRDVQHVASPMPRTLTKNDNELIVPARDGALRVLRAASDAGVARVGMTPPIAAVLYGNNRLRTFSEDDWSNLNSPKINASVKSRAIGERAARAFVASLGGASPMELTVTDPGLVMGRF